MREEWLWPVLILLLLAVGSIAYLHQVSMGTFAPCALMTTLTELQQKTIASLELIIELGLKLSTTLVGFGAALLIGVKSGLSSSPSMRALVAAAVLLFAQSALYAVWWRMGIADVYFNGCFKMVEGSLLQLRFDAHINCFMAGLGALGVVVITSIFVSKPKEYDT
jgi:hypothetical protein